jgi:hypothetical protein
VFIAPYFAEVNTQLAVSIAPPPAKANSMDEPGAPVFTITVLPTPKRRAYLFLKTHALFSDQVNVTTAADGLLSNSESTSNQQLTAILTELAAAAELGVRYGPAFRPEEINRPPPQPGPPPAPPTPREECAEGIGNLIKHVPFGALIQTVEPTSRSYPVASSTSDDGARVDVWLRLSIPAGVDPQTASVGQGVDGIVAFEPAPAVASVYCTVNGGEPLQLTPGGTLELYLNSHVVTPRRDFLRGAQETYSFNEGFITGHKYADQSAAKTVVDMITAPVRSFLPSTSVTSTTQVQTGGGKPDQTTVTTQTSSGPPKGP